MTSMRERMPRSPRSKKKWGMVIAALVIIAGALYSVFPPQRTSNVIVTIPDGAGAITAGNILVKNDVIRSSLVLRVLVEISSGDVKPGRYEFEPMITAPEVARRLTTGKLSSRMVKIRIPEGATLSEIAAIGKEQLAGFDDKKFIESASAYDGYLFPDTYFLYPTTTEEEFKELLHSQFSKVLDTVARERLSQMSAGELREKIIMASIIQKEAYGTSDAFTISGILWKRISKGMPLQVDATFAYLFNKASKDLTLTDLAYDSPYNTYKYRGLPPGPIGNPGQWAIDAAFHPAQSDYFFYLHGNDKAVRYAKTYAEHLINKKKYIDSVE